MIMLIAIIGVVMFAGMLKALEYGVQKGVESAPTPKAIESRHEVFDCAVYDQSIWEAKLIEAGIMDRADRILCDDEWCKLCKDERVHRQLLLNRAREERSQDFWKGQRLKKEADAYRDKMNKYEAQKQWMHKKPAIIDRRYNPVKDTVEVQVMTGDGKIVRTEYSSESLDYGEITVDSLLDSAVIQLPSRGRGIHGDDGYEYR